MPFPQQIQDKLKSSHQASSFHFNQKYKVFRWELGDDQKINSRKRQNSSLVILSVSCRKPKRLLFEKYVSRMTKRRETDGHASDIWTFRNRRNFSRLYQARKLDSQYRLELIGTSKACFSVNYESQFGSDRF